MTDLVKVQPKLPAKAAKASGQRVNIGALMDQCLAPFKIVHRFEAELALMKKHRRYAEDSFAFFDSRLRHMQPAQLQLAREALCEIIKSVDYERAKAGFQEILAANRDTDERLIRGLIGVMLDVLASKEADGNATYIDTLVWMISNERYDGHPVPVAAVAAAVRDTIASETFRPPISEFIPKVRTHHRTLSLDWSKLCDLKMAPYMAEECLEFLDDPKRWEEAWDDGA